MNGIKWNTNCRKPEYGLRVSKIPKTSFACSRTVFWRWYDLKIECHWASDEIIVRLDMRGGRILDFKLDLEENSKKSRLFHIVWIIKKPQINICNRVKTISIGVLWCFKVCSTMDKKKIYQLIDSKAQSFTKTVHLIS